MTPAKAKAQCMNFLAKAEVAAAAAIALPPPTTNTLGQDSIFGSFFELGKSQCFGPTILKSKMSVSVRRENSFWREN